VNREGKEAVSPILCLGLLRSDSFKGKLQEKKKKVWASFHNKGDLGRLSAKPPSAKRKTAGLFKKGRRKHRQSKVTKTPCGIVHHTIKEPNCSRKVTSTGVRFLKKRRGKLARKPNKMGH